MSFRLQREPVFMTTEEKLDKILETLARIEGRQIKTTAMVEDVVEHEAPVAGSFGTTDMGEKRQ